MDAQTFDNLVDGYLEDNLSAQQLQQLNDVLRKSPAARQRFWEHAHLETYLFELAERKRGEEASHLIAAEDAIEILLQLEEHAHPALRDVTPKAMPKPASSRKPSVHERFDAVIGRIGPVARVLAAAAVVGILLLLGWQLIVGPGSNTRSPIVADATKTDNNPQPETPSAFASLTREFQAQWDGPAPRSGEPLDRTQTFTLTHGAVDLVMESGATVALRAPARFKVNQDNSLSLDHGQAYANVPEPAIGFAVQTPQGRVVDLGTEFGVRVNEQGEGEVVVFKGLVQAQADQTTDEPVMIPANFGGTLRQGNPVAESLKPIGSFTTDDFVRDWDEVIYHPVVRKGVYHKTAPKSLVDDAFESHYVQVIAEARNVTLTAPVKATKLFVGNDVRITGQEYQFTLEPGQQVNSFLVHLDMPGSGSSVDVREVVLTFPGEVLGIIKAPDSFFATDSTLGAKDTRYPLADEKTLRHTLDPFTSPNVDSARLDTDKRTLTVIFGTVNVDAIRVIVRNTDSVLPAQPTP